MIDFDLDKQTAKDLEIFTDNKSIKSISGYFNKTKTIGGKLFLFQLMKNPITDIVELKQRSELIQFISETGFELKINSAQFDLIDHYLRLNIAPLRNNILDAFLQNLAYKINPENNYYIIKSGVQQIAYLFIHLKKKMDELGKTVIPAKLSIYSRLFSDLLQKPEFKVFYTTKPRITFTRLNKLDNLFRSKYKKEICELVNLVYQLDAFISVAKVANEKKLAIPVYSELMEQSLEIENFFHPMIENAVPNSLELNDSCNLCFLTGPNMAGKSTFLKSVGLSIYLAHLGFPVPATRMKTSIFHGIVTTINLSDDINRGYSHFFSEVNRIKETALRLKEKKKLVVIFDELFRGTNVKDAFDASLLIIKAFANIPESAFFISTHITEVAEKINHLSNIQFKYFDSKLINNIPSYDYKLGDGISYGRMGLYILKNENVIEILESMEKNHQSE